MRRIKFVNILLHVQIPGDK